MSSPNMLSRVADRVYWTARYLERVENTARLVNVTTEVLLDLPQRNDSAWYKLVEITGSTALFGGASARNQELAVCRFLLSDLSHPGSLAASLASARENARTIREILPTETWELINAAHLFARDQLTGKLSRSNRADRLRRMIGFCHRINGLLESSLSRGTAYEFLSLGRNLERADMTTRIIDVRASSEVQTDTPTARQSYWRSILRSLSADSAYRRQMQATISRSAVLDFLLHDPLHPRSLAFSINQVAEALKQLPRSRRPLTFCKELSTFCARDVERLSADSALKGFLDRCQVRLGEMHEVIAETYFKVEGQRQQQQ